MDLNTPVSFLTVGQLLDLLDEKINSKISTKEPIEKEYVYGLNGIAEALGVCTATVLKHKRNGVFKDAITQRGRKIIADKHRVIELFNQRF